MRQSSVLPAGQESSSRSALNKTLPVRVFLDRERSEGPTLDFIDWWPPACGTPGTPQAWEAVRTGKCAIDLRTATGMLEINRLAFWARGNEGGEVVEFKVGGPDILPIPGRSLESVTLTREWTEYAIELENIDPTKFVGLFVWTATDLDNPQGATFSLQDIRSEGLKP